MAQKIQVILTDDLDGGEADETVKFALDGVTYEIDVSDANHEALRAALSPYVLAGRRTKAGGRVSTRSPAASTMSVRERVDLSAIRSWARENGYQVSDRGRLSREIRAAYEAANA